MMRWIPCVLLLAACGRPLELPLDPPDGPMVSAPQPAAADDDPPLDPAPEMEGQHDWQVCALVIASWIRTDHATQQQIVEAAQTRADGLVVLSAYRGGAQAATSGAIRRGFADDDTPGCAEALAWLTDSIVINDSEADERLAHKDRP